MAEKRKDNHDFSWQLLQALIDDVFESRRDVGVLEAHRQYLESTVRGVLKLFDTQQDALLLCIIGFIWS